MTDSDETARAAGRAAQVEGVAAALEEGGGEAAELLARLLERSLDEQSIAELPLDSEPGFALLRGAIAATRQIGRHDAEAALLERAAAIRPWPVFQRQLSIARLRIGDLAASQAAKEAAIAADSDGIDERFRRHLDDLAGAGWLIDELRAPAPAGNRPARDAAVAYCLHNSLPHAAGGYAMRSHALAAAIGATGRDLIAAVRPGFPSDSTGEAADIAGEARMDCVRYIFENGFGRRGRSFGYIREAAGYYARLFEARGIGIVHAATNFWTALPAALAARRLGLPFVYEVRSFWSVTREAEEPGFRRLPQARRDDLLEQLSLALADRVLALNSAMAEHLAEFGVDPARVRIVPNCVDTGRYRPGPRDPALAGRYGIAPEDIAIGYIGAMRDYEGLDLLIDAAAGLAPDHPQLKLLIFGADPALAETPGTVEHALAARIEASGCPAIRLLPPVPPDTVPALYRSFDICAYPRRGFEVTELVPPLKPLEAMASGKPVVISDVGGMRDLVTHERTGLVCAKDDAQSLAAMLARLLDDRGLRERLGEAGRSFVSSERNWSDAAASVEGVYAGLGGPESGADGRSPIELLDALFGKGAGR